MKEINGILYYVYERLEGFGTLLWDGRDKYFIEENNCLRALSKKEFLSYNLAWIIS